jgi:phosphatidate phosphatase PAH1
MSRPAPRPSTYLHALGPLGLALALLPAMPSAAGPPAAPAATQAAPAAAQPAAPAAPRAFRHNRSRFIAASGDPCHRGRDQIVVAGEPQWLIAKFAYGPEDKDLKDEEVAIFVEPHGSAGWVPLGAARTTRDGDRATDGVTDSGGRVYFAVPAPRALPVGRHRVRLVVGGDGTSAELALHVVPPGQAIVVSDVDGTLTTSEFVEVSALARGELPDANAGAPEALRALAAQGLVPVYLTARPEWLTGRTRAFLARHGFPAGVLHTKSDKSGALGEAAAAFKRDELAALAGKGLRIAWAFGNTPSDAAAYARFVAGAGRRILYRYTDMLYGGRRVDDYRALLAELGRAP